MTITHHLDDATLMSFAAGSLPNALAAIAAAHVAGCPRCRRELRMLERIGGALVSALPPATLDRSQPTMPEIIDLPAPAPATAGELAPSLSQLIGGGLTMSGGAGSDRGCGIAP